MTHLGKPLDAGETYIIRPMAAGMKRDLEYVGSFIVPTRMKDGRYPVVDAWFNTIVLGYQQIHHNLFLVPPQRGTRSRNAVNGFIGLAYVETPAVMFEVKSDDPTPSNPRDIIGPYGRIHSIGGVTPKGYGLGYTLYCAAAYMAGGIGPRFNPGATRDSKYVEGVYSPVLDYDPYIEVEDILPSDDAEAVWTRLVTIPLGSRPPIATQQKAFVDIRDLRARGPKKTRRDWYPYRFLTSRDVADSGFVLEAGETMLSTYQRIRSAPIATPSRLAYDLRWRTPAARVTTPELRTGE